MLWILGFYHEATRPDRDDYIYVDYDTLENYEKAQDARVTNDTRRQYVKCNETTIGKKHGCVVRSQYDANSIMHYPLNRQYGNKIFKVMRLKAKAVDLCDGGKCNTGQRSGLSRQDVLDINQLYDCKKGKSDLVVLLLHL